MPNKKKSNARNTVRKVSPSSRLSKKMPDRRRSPLLDTRIIIGLVVVVIAIIIFVIIRSQAQPTAQTPTQTAEATTAAGQTPAAVQTPAAAQSPAPTSAFKQWSSYPPMTIDKTKQYTATVNMAKGGQFVIQLFPDKAPLAVNNFVFLANQGYFNGVTFHRVLENFMAQTGDPTGTGSGTPGYSFANEITDLKFDKAGVVAMANTGAPNSNGSQWFVTFVPVSYLDGGYTIFGQVTSGMDVVNGIKRRDPNQNPNFQGDAISSITIDVK
jgi:peptidylprolyl isomerase